MPAFLRHPMREKARRGADLWAALLLASWLLFAASHRSETARSPQRTTQHTETHAVRTCVWNNHRCPSLVRRARKEACLRCSSSDAIRQHADRSREMPISVNRVRLGTAVVDGAKRYP